MKHTTTSRASRLPAFQGAPLLAALALTLAGGLLAGPAAHAGGTMSSGAAAPTVAKPIGQHIIWGLVRHQSAHALVSTAAPAPAAAPAPPPSHVVWVRVRYDGYGNYEVTPADSDGDTDEDDGTMTETIPMVVAD